MCADVTFDVVVSGDLARRFAAILRSGPYAGLADLLDPPGSLLRDEVERLLEPLLLHDTAEDARQAVDAVLAVVRRHVEGLDRHGFVPDNSFGFVPGNPHVLASHPKGVWLDRADVLRLLNGGNDECRCRPAGGGR